MKARAPEFTFVFFGSGEFGSRVLNSLRDLEMLPRLVVTSPDRPRGRGRRPEPSEVKRLALELDLEVRCPERPSSREFCDFLLSLSPDYLLISDYGKILKRGLLETATLAPLNIHPSLLPRYRGAAPIERSLMAGERDIGVTLFIMDEGVDTGDMLLREKFRAQEEDTKGDLVPGLARLGVELFLDAAERFREGTIEPIPQPTEGACYAEKIRKEELWIDWNRTASEIVRRIHALSPKPGARTRLDGSLIKLLRARVEHEIRKEPGTVEVRERRLVVGTPSGSVEILELQPEGKVPMRASAYLTGHAPKRVD